MSHSAILLRLLNRLVYLDTAYISDLYEVVTGKSPKTVIAKNQGKKAGASIPLFSAEVSAQETRTYSVSSLQMLASVLDELMEEPAVEPADLRPATSSTYGWLQGELSAFSVKSTVLDSKSGEQRVLASDAYFLLRGARGADFALITTPEYFAPGMGTFLKMQQTALKELKIPVRTYARLPAARDHMGQWVAIPLVVLEQEPDC